MGILDKSLSRGKQEVSLAAFALLFSETVQYCQARSSTVPELQGKLHDLGFQVGARILDLMFVRDRAAKRELKLLNALLMVKTTLWKSLSLPETRFLEIRIFGYPFSYIHRHILTMVFCFINRKYLAKNVIY